MADFDNSLWRRGADNGALIFQLEQGKPTESNMTAELLSSFIIVESKSARTLTIVLAALNIFLASTTAFSILYDCHRTSRRPRDGFKSL
jgi:hypothetical protein